MVWAGYPARGRQVLGGRYPVPTASRCPQVPSTLPLLVPRLQAQRSRQDPGYLPSSRLPSFHQVLRFCFQSIHVPASQSQPPTVATPDNFPVVLSLPALSCLFACPTCCIWRAGIHLSEIRCFHLREFISPRQYTTYLGRPSSAIRGHQRPPQATTGHHRPPFVVVSSYVRPLSSLATKSASLLHPGRVTSLRAYNFRSINTLPASGQYTRARAC